MKKLCVLMVFLVMSISAVYQSAFAENEAMSAEIERAIAFGLVPQETRGNYDEAITFREYCAMLTNVVCAYDESLNDMWQDTISLAAQSDSPMRREDGILAAAYAMTAMGRVEYSGNDWAFFDQVQQHMNEDNHALSWDYPLFPGWDEIAFEWIGSNYMWGGVVMCAIEKSHVSGQAIYPYDFEGKSAHLSDALMRSEAICTVIRLAEAMDIDFDVVSAPEDMDFSAAQAREKELRLLAEEKKQRILENNESVGCTGTAYYISNSGSDSNDGTSPETAWATLEHLRKQPFSRGDAVYFERGGVWRGAMGYYYEDVTVSAYGEGPKPRIYGSPENGADADKWTLYSEENDVRIWKYMGTNSECAGIVLNDGQAVARRVHARFDGKQYFDSASSTQPFDLKEALCKDLYFYCDMAFESQELPIYPDTDVLPKQIYLRCDAGNPGEVYDSIEFISKTVTEDVAAIAFGPDGVLDNICFMYHAGTVVSMTEYDRFTVQNCEIGWCGTRLECFVETEDDMPGIWTDGNAIQIIGSDCLVQNNYIHDVEGGGISLELGGDISSRVPFGGNVIRGNLIERCGDPLYIRDNDQDETVDKAFGDMVIADNAVFDTGYGWYENQPSYINPAFYTGHSLNALNFYGRIAGGGEAVRVENNVFCRAYHGLLYFNPGGDMPALEGNIFMQEYGRTLMETPGAVIKAMQMDEIQAAFDSLNNDTEDVMILLPES